MQANERSEKGRKLGMPYMIKTLANYICKDVLKYQNSLLSILAIVKIINNSN